MGKVVLIAWVLYCCLVWALVWALYLTYDPSHWWAALTICLAVPAVSVVGGWIGYHLARMIWHV